MNQIERTRFIEVAQSAKDLAQERVSLRAELRAARACTPTTVCDWREDADGNWDTDCGETFVIIDGTPRDNGMIYCCYCGKNLSPVPYTEPESEHE